MELKIISPVMITELHFWLLAFFIFFIYSLSNVSEDAFFALIIEITQTPFLSDFVPLGFLYRLLSFLTLQQRIAHIPGFLGFFHMILIIISRLYYMKRKKFNVKLQERFPIGLSSHYLLDSAYGDLISLYLQIHHLVDHPTQVQLLLVQK